MTSGVYCIRNTVTGERYVALEECPIEDLAKRERAWMERLKPEFNSHLLSPVVAPPRPIQRWPIPDEYSGPNELLTVVQVAAELGMSTGGIRRAIKSGRITSQQVGRAHLLYRKDVAELSKLAHTHNRPRGSANVTPRPKPPKKGRKA